MAESIATLIEEEGGIPEASPYAIESGQFNFVRLPHLLPALTETLARNVRQFQAVVEKTRPHPLAHAKLREIHQRKQRFNEKLEDLKKRLAASTPALA